MAENKKQAPAPESKKSEATPLTPQEKAERNLGLDRLITWGLILIGIYSVFTGLGDYVNPRPVMNAMFEEMNTIFPEMKLGSFENVKLATTLGWVAVTLQAIVLALTVWFAQKRMKAKKFSWWIPVVGAFVANILSMVCVGIALGTDPGFQAGWANLMASVN